MSTVAWYQKNKEGVKARMRDYYVANKARIKKRIKASQQAHPDRSALYRKRRRYRTIKAIFDILGYKCSLCPEIDPHVLQIDHVNGGGRQHGIRANWAVGRYYGEILKSVQESRGEYRTLCAN